MSNLSSTGYTQVVRISKRRWYVYVFEGMSLTKVHLRFSRRGAQRLANRLEKKVTKS